MKNLYTLGTQRIRKWRIPALPKLFWMKVSFIFISFLFTGLQLIMAYPGYGQGLADKKIHLQVYDEVLPEIFKQIENQTSFHFAYNPVIAQKYKATVEGESISVEKALKKVLKDTPFKYQLIGDKILITSSSTESVIKPLFSGFNYYVSGTIELRASALDVSGTVSDEEGNPLIGVNVLVKGTNKGTATDFEGKFTLTDVDEQAILVFSYIGYQHQEIPLKGRTKLSVFLKEDVQTLDEVVVTALGIKKEEKALGYAVQKVDGESLQKVSGVDAATSLTGKVAGLLVKNPTDFNVVPEITVRGEEPLLVIDGIAYANKTLNDISSEDIESMSVLKGATASALYGFRGASGAILITTKNGSSGERGMTADFTTNTMFTAGYLAIPEKQNVYGRGSNNTYNLNQDESWGQVMDGSIQTQWDPIAKKFRDFEYLPIGKNNFGNFLEQGYVTNNNFNVAYNRENIALRSSVNWTENKGRYPNSKLDKYAYSFGGDISLDKFNLTSNLSYAKRESPNMGSNGYTSYDPMYTLLIWSPSDFNVLDYKDNYWLIPGVLQNNQYGYDFENNRYRGKNQNSPYFDRYEKTNEVSRDIFNADLSLNYELTDWLKATIRSGIDFYIDRGQIRVSQGSYVQTGNTGIPGNPNTWNGRLTGAYLSGKTQGFSSNSDLLLTGSRDFNKFEVDYLAGGTIFYKRNDNINAETIGGISVPGFFSLNASVEPATVAESTQAQQVNSAFGRLSISWNRLLYIEATGRNDWSSTLAGPNVPNSQRSYFYPSFSSSFIISELLPESSRNWLDLLKIRNSWTQSKRPAGIYDINNVYTINTGTWNDLNGAKAPTSLYDLASIQPQSANTYEIGLQGMMFIKRLTVDISYYTKRMYDLLEYAPITPASGYNSKYINIDEERSRRGWELALTTSPVRSNDFQLDLGLNWSTFKEVYTRLDDLYSDNNPWVKVGDRTDTYVGKEFLKVPETGEHIYSNGRIQRSNYNSVFGYKDPDWIWGVNSTLRYKNLSLYVSTDGVVGGLMNTRTESYMWQSGVHPKSVTEARALDVAEPGSANYIGDGVKVISGSVEFDTDGNITSDTRKYAPNDVAITYLRAAKDLHNSSAWGGTGTTADAYEKTFLKLREISLTYHVPGNILDKWGLIKKASVSLIGQNVLLWSKDFKYSDPDGGKEDFSDPSVRYLGANIKFTF